LEFVYPTPNVRPSYVWINKACMVLRHLITSCDWNIWKTTLKMFHELATQNTHTPMDYMQKNGGFG
ncbi:hypothetical protein BDQ17DRAFT_1262656, partial [Cyathus striatus]